jgi:hypothetical protein
MQKVIGWIIFVMGVLITAISFGAAGFLFVSSFFATEESQAGVQAIGLGCAIIGIPFYFLARFGWRLKYPQLSGKSQPRSYQASRVNLTGNKVRSNPNEGENTLAVIDILSNKGLFFTSKRVIVANFEQSMPSWAIPLTLFSPGSPTSQSKAKRVKKLRPEEILVEDAMNYAINYPEIQSVTILRKFLGYKIRINAKNPAISTKSGFFGKRIGTEGNIYRFEFWLQWPWRWKKYVNSLRMTLPDKLEPNYPTQPEETIDLGR